MTTTAMGDATALPPAAAAAAPLEPDGRFEAAMEYRRMGAEAGDDAWPSGSHRSATPLDFETTVSAADEAALAGSRKRASRLFWVQAAYIAVGAVLGTLLRALLAQLIAGATTCASSPGDVGWLAAESPLCVTADGDISQQGGVVFADLAANMLGCFLMGLVLSGEYLHLALPQPLAWLRPDHPLQSMEVLHTAFRTGFCGSLTTFSGWNAAMVVLMFGTGSDAGHARVGLALLGYVVGVETAQGSLAAGKALARHLHGRASPGLVREAALLRERRAEGVHLHTALPDYERRVLLDLAMEPLAETEEIIPLNRQDLERWRDSTRPARRVHHPLLPALVEIERAALVLNLPVPRDAAAVARAEGWDLDALQAWVDEKAKLCAPTGLNVWNKGFMEKTTAVQSRWLTLPVASFILWFLVFVLVLTVFLLPSDEATARTYRTMIVAMLVAPLGACLRWRLGALNGSLSICPWFPLGTFTANVVGSLISITCVALEFQIQKNYISNFFWAVGVVRVIRIGFAGGLTTVSTFVAETNDFMHKKTNHAYPYIVTTILSACIPSAIVYAVLVYAV